MIYNIPISVCRLPDGVGNLNQAGKLSLVFMAFCAELEVYHARFWESVQADSRIDTMVQIPLRRDATAHMYAVLGDHTYRIEQAQFLEDEFGLPVTRLSLMRMEHNYDIAGI